MGKGVLIMLTQGLNSRSIQHKQFVMLEVFHYSSWQTLKLPQMGYALGWQSLFCLESVAE